MFVIEMLKDFWNYSKQGEEKKSPVKDERRQIESLKNDKKVIRL